MNEYTLKVMYKRSEFYRELIKPENGLSVNLDYNKSRYYWWVTAELEQISRRSKRVMKW